MQPPGRLFPLGKGVPGLTISAGNGKGRVVFEDWIDLVFSVVHILKSGQDQGMGREEVWEGCG